MTWRHLKANAKIAWEFCQTTKATSPSRRGNQTAKFAKRPSFSAWSLANGGGILTCATVVTSKTAAQWPIGPVSDFDLPKKGIQRWADSLRRKSKFRCKSGDFNMRTAQAAFRRLFRYFFLPNTETGRDGWGGRNRTVKFPFRNGPLKLRRNFRCFAPNQWPEIFTRQSCWNPKHSRLYQADFKTSQ